MMYGYPSKIFAVVVLYNKSVNESNSICSLLKTKLLKLQIIVVDNSTIKNNNEVECLSNGIVYISMNENLGLSKAYNTALDYIEKYANQNDLIIWFDDDTQLTEEYFISLNNALIKNNNTDFFVPIIYGQNGKIYSPNNAGFLKNKLLKSIDEQINPRRFNAINSCLAVRQRIYQNYRYNEKLFLDSVDHNFFEDMRNQPIKFAILNTRITQSFFQRGNELNVVQAKNRLKIRVVDLMTYSQRSIKYTFLGVVKAAGWGVVFTLKCKSISLFFICIKYTTLGFFNNLFIFMKFGKTKINLHKATFTK